MTQRVLPKIVTPLADELFSGWLTRLAITNHCELYQLLAHIGVDTRQAAMLDFEVQVASAEKISTAARVDAEIIRSLAFGAMTQTETLMTAQIVFQSCPDCSRRGIALKHWRRTWAFDCQICGRVARKAVWSNCVVPLRRAMRAVTFAIALRSARADSAFALQRPRPDVRLVCLAAIAVAQSRPLVKAAMFSIGIDGDARVALLRAFKTEPRLLAAVDQSARRKMKSTTPQTAD